MYEYFKGKLVVKAPTHVVLDVSGIGYYLHISLTTYSQIKDQEDCKLYASFQVREDSQTLYGFATEAERHLFHHLISVSGIGPNTGRMMLSSITPEEIQQAIVSGQVNVIQKIKGIGPKTAQRVILELQDKLKKTRPRRAYPFADFKTFFFRRSINGTCYVGIPESSSRKSPASYFHNRT
jgi:Holliday junction DNA helicase RuvA